MNSALSRQKRRRHRRKMKRGRMLYKAATAISTRTRWKWWPVTRSITRYHRNKWHRRPRCKWREIEEYEYERRYAS